MKNVSLLEVSRKTILDHIKLENPKRWLAKTGRNGTLKTYYYQKNPKIRRLYQLVLTHNTGLFIGFKYQKSYMEIQAMSYGIHKYRKCYAKNGLSKKKVPI